MRRIACAALCILLLACGRERRPTAQDSGAGRQQTWSDADVISYTYALARTLAADTLLARRVNSVAVRSFIRRVAFQGAQLAARADSLLPVRTAIPASASVVLDSHSQSSRALRTKRGVDTAYVRAVVATLGDAQQRLRAARLNGRAQRVGDLIDLAEQRVSAELLNARAIEAALTARQAPPSGAAGRP